MSVLARRELLGGGPPVATYSIIGIDPEADLIGVALQSHYFAVGSLAPWAEPGVGAVIIQSIPKMGYDYGLAGLKMLREGHSGATTLERLVGEDDNRAYRQVAIADARGGAPANFTGACCVPEAGSVRGETFACQSNMMENTGVPEAMAEAFTGEEGQLTDRLLAALRAAESKGGDLRGQRAAALLIVRRQPEGHHVRDVPFDLRVDDHDRPLEELERLVRMKSAFRYSMRGDAALVREEFEEALALYERADAIYSGQTELYFWRSLALLNQGRREDALRWLRELFESDPKWEMLFERAALAGLISLEDGLRDWLRDVSQRP